MALQSKITALIWIIGALCERGVSWLLCCFSAETMEKLLKREKEVSTLTSQVEALKSQIGGKQARSALFPSSPTSLFFQRFRDKISWNIEFLQRHCVFHVQVFHFRIKRGEAWYFPAAFPSSLGFKLRTCQLSLSINKKNMHVRAATGGFIFRQSRRVHRAGERVLHRYTLWSSPRNLLISFITSKAPKRTLYVLQIIKLTHFEEGM